MRQILRPGIILGLVLAPLAWSGCSTSSTTTTGSADSAELPPAGNQVLIIDDISLVKYDVDTKSAEAVSSPVEFDGFVSHSPDGSRTLLSVRRNADTYLSLVTEDGSLRDLDTRPGQVSYSVAWAPSGDSLIFGFSSTTGRGIRQYDFGSGKTVDVGCSASSIALSWGSANWFLVGNGPSHYVVRRSGCGTIGSVDARKMHEVAFGPDGARVAYVLRQLEYNRPANQYLPDSSLHVSAVNGTDAVLVAGDRYKPHRPSWSPDGKLIAFDARVTEDSPRRLISIYDLEDGRSAFLNPTSVDADIGEWNPHWSPTGHAIAYTRSSGGDEPLVTIRDLAGSHATVVGNAGERVGGWLDERHLILKGSDATRVVNLDGSEAFTLESAARIVRRIP